MLQVDLWEQCCHSVTWERLFTSLLLKRARPGPQVSAFFLAPIAACLTWKSALPAGASHAVPGISKWFQWFQVSGGFDTPFLIFFGIANQINHGIWGYLILRPIFFYCLDDPSASKPFFWFQKKHPWNDDPLELWMLGNSVISRKVTTCWDEFTAPPRQVSSLSFYCFLLLAAWWMSRDLYICLETFGDTTSGCSGKA